MRRTTETLLLLAAAGIAAILLSGVAGWLPGAGRTGRISAEGDRTFHGGKPEGKAAADPRCQTGSCHPFPPHRRGAAASFRNMHAGIVDCLVCHGGAADREWRIGEAEGERPWRILSGVSVPERNPHAALASPRGCRGCHSEEGRKRIESIGGRSLPAGFANPISLRMLEEESRKWIPGDLR